MQQGSCSCLPQQSRVPDLGSNPRSSLIFLSLVEPGLPSGFSCKILYRLLVTVPSSTWLQELAVDLPQRMGGFFLWKENFG